MTTMQGAIQTGNEPLMQFLVNVSGVLLDRKQKEARARPMSQEVQRSMYG